MKEYYTDWLGSKPIFYNENTGGVSENINDVIELENLQFDPEGFNNYLEFGYSVFGQTPIKGVKFLRHSSRLTIDNNEKISVDNFVDPFQKFINLQSNENDVFASLKRKIKNLEDTTDYNIIIPLSGGFDSRLLMSMIKDKKRIFSFTFGISDNQKNSFEVVYAKKICEILNVKWQQIQLGNFHNYFDEWNRLFGISTHAHGMYQIEFYNKIKDIVDGPSVVLSGIIGDAWAGSVNIEPINSPNHLNQLGYTHGLHANPEESLLKSKNILKMEYFQQQKTLLQDNRFRIVEAMRFKIILLSYLMRVPNFFGLNSWTPFLDIELAMKMLNLPYDRRKDRIWQQEYFQKKGLDVESMNLTVDRRNSLNYCGMNEVRLEPLKPDLFEDLINTKYIEWINNTVCYGSIWEIIIRHIEELPKMRGFFTRFGYRDRILSAYCAYLTLKPIEFLRNKSK